MAVGLRVRNVCARALKHRGVSKLNAGAKNQGQGRRLWTVGDAPPHPPAAGLVRVHMDCGGGR